MNRIINRLAKAIAFFLAAVTVIFGLIFGVGIVKILVRTLAVYLFFLYEIRFLGRVIGRMMVFRHGRGETTPEEGGAGLKVTFIRQEE